MKRMNRAQRVIAILNNCPRTTTDWIHTPGLENNWRAAMTEARPILAEQGRQIEKSLIHRDPEIYEYRVVDRLPKTINPQGEK